jgi:hypothetical protein
MSEKKRSRKIITTAKQKRTSDKRYLKDNTQESVEMLLKKKNFYFVFAGLLVMALGFVLMSGGVANPTPDTFETDSIYSFRRVFLAPLIILIGLGLNIYAIFKK